MYDFVIKSYNLVLDRIYCLVYTNGYFLYLMILHSEPSDKCKVMVFSKDGTLMAWNNGEW